MRQPWLAAIVALALLTGGCDHTCPVGHVPATDAGGDGAGLVDAGGSDADSPRVGWAVSFGAEAGDSVGNMVIDPAGELVVSGFFNRTVRFGATTLTSAPKGSTFVARLDRSGAFRWAVRLDGVPVTRTLDPWRQPERDGLAVDPSGDIYYAGQFAGSATFGTTKLSSAGAEDIFVVKLGPQGTALWAVSAGGPGTDLGDALAVGPDGALTLGARFAATASLGGQIHTARGASDLLVARLDADGRFVWASPAGSAAAIDESVSALVQYSTGETYVTGSVGPDASFGGLTLAGNPGTSAAFVARLDTSGAFVWAAPLSNSVHGAGMTLGPDGLLHVVSNTNDTEDGFLTLLGDALLSKIDTSNGGRDYSSKVGSSRALHANDLVVDGKGNTTLVGFFTGTISLGSTPVAGELSIPWPLVARLDPVGKVTGGAGIPTSGNAVAVARDASGSTYVAGEFNGSADFGGTRLSSGAPNASDGFIWNLGPEQE